MSTPLTKAEAAKFVGLSQRTLVAEVRAGRVRGVKLTKEWRFFEEDLTKYMQSNYACCGGRVSKEESCLIKDRVQVSGKLPSTEYESLLELTTSKKQKH